MTRNGSRILRLALLALLMLATPFTASSAKADDCSTGTAPTCAYVTSGHVRSVVPTAFGVATPTCRQVADNCTSDIMVPTGSQAEWTSFVNNHESCAVLSACPPLTVSLSASPTSVNKGGSTTLTWTITGNLGSMTGTGSSSDSPSTWTQNYSYATGVVASGTATVYPSPPNGSNSTTYTLSVTDSVMGAASGSIAVGINSIPAQCGSNVQTDGNGNITSGTACAVGNASAVNGSGAYSCTNGASNVSCAATVAAVCAPGP